ncbi:MAG: hypothetical protein GY881_15160 [Gammaproteobacteria bacterium]|jgi:hypothetical protein|nr:hypothetical protein [Gammaproteobacteria bacterium]
MSYTVVAKDDKGGFIYSFNSGGKKRYGYKSDEYSTTDKDTVLAILKDIKSGAEGAGTPAVVKQRGIESMQKQIVEQAPVSVRAQKFAEGIPFAGSWIDEAGQAISPELGTKAKAASKAMQAQHPIESEALKLGGAIASTAPLGLLGGGFRSADSVTRAGKMAKGAGIGGLLGASEGFVHGAGEAEAGQRLEGGKTGAAFGGLTGGAFGSAAPLIGEGVANLVGFIKRSDLGVIQATLGVSATAAKVIKDVMGRGGDLESAIGNIQRAGEQGMIADANEAIQVLLDATATASPKATQTVSEAVTGRAVQASGKIDEVMTKALGAAPKGRISAAEEIAKRTSKERGEAYKIAYNTPIDYATPQGVAIEEIFKRIPNDLMSKAIKAANDRMKFSGLGHEQVMATVAEDGSISFSKMPNMVQLDHIKRVLGNMAEDAKGPLGQDTSDSMFYGDISGQLRNVLVEAVPSYGQALQLGGDNIREQMAGELGYKLLRPSTTREQIARALVKATDAEKQTARLGVRNFIDDTLANVKATISSPDVDVKAASRLLSELSSKANQEKLGFILGPKEAKQMSDQIEQVRAALELQAAVAVNSKTAQRQAVQEMVGDLTDAGPLQTLLTGHPAQATQKVVQALTGATKEMQASQKAQLFEELATVLTNKRGKEAQIALRLIMKAMDGQELANSQAQLVANVVIMGTAAPAATQSGKALSE